MDFNAKTEDVSEWFTLAFQESTSEMAFFADNIALRASHFREVAAKIKQKLEGGFPRGISGTGSAL
jgi:hypothetical protein